MSFTKIFFIALLTSCAFMNAYATTYYRHAPFHLSMNANDTLVVNYDFEKQSGVRCSSNQKNICMNFFYKGSEKNTVIPITLLNDHLPDKKSERLADTLGQFTIRIQPSANIQHAFVVSCEYVD